MPDDRDRLLEAALTHVPFEGMNDRALIAGARDLGLPPALARVLFPQGGAGLAAAYHRKGDAALWQWLARQPADGRMRDRIAGAIRPVNLLPGKPMMYTSTGPTAITSPCW